MGYGQESLITLQPTFSLLHFLFGRIRTSTRSVELLHPLDLFEKKHKMYCTNHNERKQNICQRALPSLTLNSIPVGCIKEELINNWFPCPSPSDIPTGFSFFHFSVFILFLVFYFYLYTPSNGVSEVIKSKRRARSRTTAMLLPSFVSRKRGNFNPPVTFPTGSLHKRTE